jgi:hypothetical protein
MSDRLSITRSGEHFVLRSSDPSIKQTFFSWGSSGTGLRIKEHPEYYGQDVDPREPPPGTVLRGEDAHRWATTPSDDHLWEWRLTDDSAEDLVELIDKALANPSRYNMDATEIESSEHVRSVLRKVLER